MKAIRPALTRRDFLFLSAASLLSGCATNPVTGRRQLLLMSRAEEISVDRSQSPHQFSADYGPLQDEALNRYISSVGETLLPVVQRQDMPYSFRGVNAAYVNAYAFPGGSIAVTRGMLLELHNEAELAGVLGHELGHVNARHAAQQATSGVLTSLAVAGVSAFVESRNEKYAAVTAGLGQVAAGALLAKYSRDDEREADALGMDYLVRAGYSPQGIVGVMEVLKGLATEKPGVIDTMFATHPMSEERYQTAVARLNAEPYAAALGQPVYAERYMDNTAGVRKLAGAIRAMQEAEKAMGARQYPAAEQALRKAVREAPEDYAARVLLSKCLLAQGQSDEARKQAAEAARLYPGEGQAMHLLGMSALRTRKFDAAYAAFADYGRALPGNPNTVFFQGMALEGMGRRREAAQAYRAFLGAVPVGANATFAERRLVEWGYVRQAR